MKTTRKLFSKLLLVASVIFAVSCSKDEPANPTTGDSDVKEIDGTISPDEFETDPGQIGILISVREIARKGHKPVEAVFTLGTSAIATEPMLIDTLNSNVSLSYNLKDLRQIDPALEDELKDGISVDVAINDKDGNPLASQSFPIIQFGPNPISREVNSDSLEDLYANVVLNGNVKYMVQVVDQNNRVIGAPVSQLWQSVTDTSAPIVTKRIDDENIVYPSAYTANFTTFYFEEVAGEEDVFHISVREGSDIYYLYSATSGNAFGQTNIQSVRNLEINGSNTDPTNLTRYKFRVEKYAPGLFTITSLSAGKKLVLAGNFEDGPDVNDLRLVAKDETTEEKTAYFRLLNTEIDWIIQTSEATFGNPVLPPSQTKITEVNVQLLNCSQGDGSIEIGTEQTETTLQTSSWSETFSVVTTNQAGGSLTLGYEGEVSWFGVKGKASVEATGNYSWSKSETETNTFADAITNSEKTKVSFVRTINVPSGAGTSVADIFQVYPKIEVPFVQQFTIEGNYRSGEALTGAEILTQFAFNSFTGVVTEVQDNFIKITVRGLTTIDNLIRIDTELRDVPNPCGD